MAGPMPAPKLDFAGGTSGASAGFDTGISSPINFGDYNGGASTGGGSPPVLATALANNGIAALAAFVVVSFVVLARKKRGK